MTASEILIHELRTGRPAPLAGAAAPSVVSSGLSWSGVALEQQALAPAETPEGLMPWHLFVVLLRPPALLEDFCGRTVRRWRPAPGDVAFRPAGVPNRASWTSSSETINLIVDPARVGEGARFEASRFGPDPVVRHLALALLAEANAPSPASALFADGARDALSWHLLQRYATSSSEPARGPTRLTAVELRRVRERVEAGLAEDLRVADLAAAVPLSPAHFSRAFRATTGLTPHRYVMERRLDAARRLLMTTALDLQAVARRTGFADRSHLTRHIRRSFGLPPGELRRQARGGAGRI